MAMATMATALLMLALATASASAAVSGAPSRSRSPRPEADLVTGLPGQPAVGFSHYAGYVDVAGEGGGGKALFYWFFEAEREPDKKPLLLWLNGGPGCSSVAYGAAQELGPFLVRSYGTNLTRNAYAWNKAVNLLFLEAPVGVGFSYTNRTSDLRRLGDRVTAQDSYSFLLGWLDKFPEFKGRDFYIAGESYAGHYVPQLAELIYDGNKAASRDRAISIKGFMIGNAVLNDATDQLGMVEYAWSHAIISDELYSAVRRECDSFKEEADGGRPGKGCSPALRAFLGAYDDIDIYSIYTPTCLLPNNVSSAGRPAARLVAAPRLLSKHEEWHRLMKRVPAGYDPCTEAYVTNYFNRGDVQRALHANRTRLPYPYSPCSEVIRKWNDSPATVLPILKKLMAAGLRVWVYSGDTDGRVPVTSTRYSINTMGLRRRQRAAASAGGVGGAAEWGGWRAWYYRQQVAGWAVEYEEGLTLVTVRGAGHQVPLFAPDRSLAMLYHFLRGQALPAARSSG
ncbi:serine carboxypeptidase-like 35 [Sorghum bicolor]|uniref:serine carboxypeptidase-like 35 n=1 Tax=Sorghum bicolor TaxID=4558 RepID=UPI0001A873BB|nr:serine carboxypeptidase-like 35 [Sorghum bicolor]|eukprot:XP_002448207.1 serine carboxypeptidase-like 35 [Sorghum bicolor]